MTSPAEAGTLTTTALLTSLVGGAPPVDDSIAESDGAIAAAADVAGASPVDRPRRSDQLWLLIVTPKKRRGTKTLARARLDAAVQATALMKRSRGTTRMPSCVRPRVAPTWRSCGG